MLKFNPKRIFAMRGIEKMTGFLVKLGMSYPTASRFLKAESNLVNIKAVEKLCLALNCTPNDLFEWHSDALKTVFALIEKIKDRGFIYSSTSNPAFIHAPVPPETL